MAAKNAPRKRKALQGNASPQQQQYERGDHAGSTLPTNNCQEYSAIATTATNLPNSYSGRAFLAIPLILLG